MNKWPAGWILIRDGDGATEQSFFINQDFLDEINKWIDYKWSSKISNFVFWWFLYVIYGFYKLKPTWTVATVLRFQQSQVFKSYIKMNRIASKNKNHKMMLWFILCYGYHEEKINFWGQPKHRLAGYIKRWLEKRPRPQNSYVGVIFKKRP